MPVDVEIRRISMHPFANMIRHPADGENIARAVEGQCVFGVQPFAGENFPGDRFEPGVIGLEWMGICHWIHDTAADAKKSQALPGARVRARLQSRRPRHRSNPPEPAPAGEEIIIKINNYRGTLVRA